MLDEQLNDIFKKYDAKNEQQRKRNILQHARVCEKIVSAQGDKPLSKM